MPKSTSLAAAALVGLAALAFSAGAQQAAPQSQGAVTQAAPANPVDDPAPPATGGIQGQNIFDVKPEVKRDASSEPGYMEQNNAQRNAVQPGNNAPMWRQVQRGLEGFTSLPRSQAPEAGVLIQGQVRYPGTPLTTAGEAWRQVRNNFILPYGGALLLIVLLAIAIFYFTRGTIEQHGADTGRRIERFTPFERAAHWTNATAFVILAVSGIMMAFGRYFLLPVIGGTLFGWLTWVLKTLHNFVGPLFVVSLVIVILTFLRDNLPQRGDLRWMLKAGGVFGKGGEVPSHRFNAGEKAVFWGGVFLLGLVVVGSGLVLDKLIPGLLYERATMQVANIIHAVAAVLMMGMFMFHIYMGTLGMRGAFSAMRTGWVDETWAREHHEYWYEDIKAGKIPAERSRQAQMQEPDARTPGVA